VSLGEAPKQLDLLDPVTRFCDESLPTGSIYGFLFRERDRLFPDDLFPDDLFAAIGRRSVLKRPGFRGGFYSCVQPQWTVMVDSSSLA
jgi:hypothetical protein